MTILRRYFIDALILAILWTLGGVSLETSFYIQSYADLINVFVLVVFIQFLYQNKPPLGYQRYLVLSYTSLVYVAVSLLLDAPAVFIIFGSGLVFSLSIVFLLWSIIKG
jgi:hypothetical protein